MTTATTIECRTRDGRTHEFPGPPNMPNGDHRVSMRFSSGEGVWSVTFRKYANSPVFGEIAATKNGVDQ